MLFDNPIAPVLIGLVIVLGVGFWVMNGDKDEPASGSDKQEQADKGGSETGSPTTPTTPTTPATEAPKTETPPKTEAPRAETPKAEEKPVTDGAVLAARSKIDRSAGAAETMLVTVYYSDGLKDGLSLQPVEVKVPRSVSRIKVTAEQIIDAPQDLKLFSNIPAGTKVTANLKDGVAIVDLTGEVTSVRGAAAVNNIMASFVYSLTAIPDVKAVQLWVNGKPAMLDGVEWAKPLSRADLEARNLYKVEPVVKYAGS